jgi:arsenate reductase-like glutaredoxin family protein
LEAMIAKPLLIRRPLMQVGDRRETGFEPALVEAWIGLAEPVEGSIEGCPRQ